MSHNEEEISRKVLYEGPIFTLRSHRVLLENGAEAQRDVVNHHGGVCIAAVDREDRILLVRQYRFAVGEELLELPAGKLEPGEEPLVAAAREFTEETGMRAQRLEKLTQMLPTPAYCTEVIHIYEAKGLLPGRQSLDPDEFLDVVRMPFAEALEKALSGEIKDGKTQTAVLMLASRRGSDGKTKEEIHGEGEKYRWK